MRRKYIFVDMDGVIAEFSNPLTGTVVVDNDDWNTPGIFIDKKPVNPVINAVIRLRNSGDTMPHQLMILSAAPNNMAIEEKHAWLDKYFDEIIIDDRFFLPFPGEDKRKFIINWCLANDIAPSDVILIDDSHHHLFACAKFGIEVMHPSVLLTRY